MAINFKPVQPVQLNVQAILNNLEKGLNDTSNGVLLDCEAYTATWKTDVKWKKNIIVKPDYVEMTVDSDNVKPLLFVEKGTKPHPIPKVPKTKGSLAYPSMFSPKTQPGRMVSNVGSHGGPIRFAKQVQHPGTKARNFTKELEKKWRLAFWKRMDKAMRDSAKASGFEYQYK